VITILVVLAGLLAMHGLAGGHHVEAPSTWAAASADAAPAALGHAAHAAGSAATGGVDLLASDALVPDSGQGQVSGLMTLCLAVLVGGLLLLLLLLGQRWRAALVGARPRPAVALLPRTPRPPRPPDLVAELCVSRT